MVAPGQFTNVWQYHRAFRSSVLGPNSLDPGSRGNETIDLTLFAGVRVFDNVELYINPEVDQGFGLSNTLGVAGFPSGEAYKVGKSDPYFRLQRLFGRITFDLAERIQDIAPGPNQLGGSATAKTSSSPSERFRSATSSTRMPMCTIPGRISSTGR